MGNFALAWDLFEIRRRFWNELNSYLKVPLCRQFLLSLLLSWLNFASTCSSGSRIGEATTYRNLNSNQGGLELNLACWSGKRWKYSGQMLFGTKWQPFQSGKIFELFHYSNSAYQNFHVYRFKKIKLSQCAITSGFIERSFLNDPIPIRSFFMVQDRAFVISNMSPLTH